MLDDTKSCWWYEQDGQQAGPVTAGTLARLAAEGRLGPGHRVWRDGMAAWQPLGTVAELAEALAGARPPPVSAPPPPAWGAPPPPWGSAHAGAPSALEEISPGAMLILSIVTFGIYGLVKFFQTGKGYEALAGRASHFSRNFWLFIGLGVASVFFNAGGPFVGAPVAIASLVFQVLTLFEALKLRDEAVHRAGIHPQITGDGTHKALFILGLVLSPAGVGLVLLLVQAWKWFSDWNAIGAALAGGAPAASAGASASR